MTRGVGRTFDFRAGEPRTFDFRAGEPRSQACIKPRPYPAREGLVRAGGSGCCGRRWQNWLSHGLDTKGEGGHLQYSTVHV
jgi:hypothetical protein